MTCVQKVVGFFTLMQRINLKIGTVYEERAKRADSETVSAEVGGVKSEGIR